MPVFISSEEEFIDVARKAEECRVKRIPKKNIAKVKARTKRYLYTYKIQIQNLDALLEKLKSVCKNIVEV
ncbi:5'-nucleotidase [Ignisphaera sp. 4213-co]|uniref:5'-nucleotidase n=1 Tax=Ignisphaera cupida TaxID=3050454 RepID=A0ABD4Z4J2_9CREN|nr:5'-nucleotidase [Ignisphaera sp. 4213-co]MDK6028237.1 5'-nucleotidase [Ignisphaera sp. 4213-co]